MTAGSLITCAALTVVAVAGERLGIIKPVLGKDDGGNGPRFTETTLTPASVCILPTFPSAETSTATATVTATGTSTETSTPTSTPTETPTSVVCVPATQQATATRPHQENTPSRPTKDNPTNIPTQPPPPQEPTRDFPPTNIPTQPAP